MCGKGSIEKIQQNWSKYVPKILEMEQGCSEIMDEEGHLKALQILDRKLRSGGAAHRASAAFSIYEVKLCTYSNQYFITVQY